MFATTINRPFYAVYIDNFVVEVKENKEDKTGTVSI